MPAPVRLDRRMGLLQATSTNIISMVGVGPFLTIPFMIQAMNGPHILYAWVAGAVLALADGLVYAQLGAALPGSGRLMVRLCSKWGPLCGSPAGAWPLRWIAASKLFAPDGASAIAAAPRSRCRRTSCGAGCWRPSAAIRPSLPAWPSVTWVCTGVTSGRLFNIEQDFGCINIIDFVHGKPFLRLANFTLYDQLKVKLRTHSLDVILGLLRQKGIV